VYRELTEFVQKEHSLVGERNLARDRHSRPTADHRGE
jgi:hypothetical protein